MFPNLKAEMTRNQINQKDLAELLNLNKATISDKMTGKVDFWFLECKKIRDFYFCNLSLDYLFEPKEELNKEEE